MRIHKEGYTHIAVTTLIVGVINAVSIWFLSSKYPLLSIAIFAVTMLLWFLVIYFFRVPNRDFIVDADKIIAPADGKVVVIEEMTDTEYFNDRRIQISIFMSPLNVHLNRNAVSGKVLYSKHHDGKYLVAWHPKSSTDNERHSVVYQSGQKQILVKQIAGALAKRIVNYLKPGMEVSQGDEMGFIKFGSRVDVLLPLDAKIKVHLNQVVQGGITVLAEWQ